jgi:GNAT superfamily N-acetyltransferase
MIETRLLGVVDAAALDAFLKPVSIEAYYLRGNAVAAGLIYHGRPLEADYVGAFEQGRMVGAVAYTWLDTLLLKIDAPAATAGLARAIAERVVARGGRIEAVLGLADEAEPFIDALGLTARDMRHDVPDELFYLDYAALRFFASPEGWRVRRAVLADVPWLVGERVAFNIESLGATPGAELQEKVEAEIGRRLPEGEWFVLESPEGLRAFCGVSGSLPEAVIVGPVWTPPSLRGKGLGKAVVSGALTLIRQERPALQGVVLFASRPDAIRLYQAVGFKRRAAWRLAMLREDYRLSAVASEA